MPRARSRRSGVAPPRTIRRGASPRTTRAGVIGAIVRVAAPVILCALLACVPIARAEPADSLWRRAVDLADTHRGWVPGYAETVVEELAGDGSVKHRRTSGLRLFLNDVGELDQELVTVTEDGADITADERKALREERRRREARDGEAAPAALMQPFTGPLPFLPEAQSNVMIQRVEAAGAPEGGPHVAFEFRHDFGAAHQIRGLAWLDAPTGTPVQVRFTPEPLPSGVKELKVTMRFSDPADSAWTMRTIEIEGTSRFLFFFTRRYRTQTTFRDYWWNEAAARAEDSR